jgi:hypothetical protein
MEAVVVAVEASVYWTRIFLPGDRLAKWTLTQLTILYN